MSEALNPPSREASKKGRIRIPGERGLKFYRKYEWEAFSFIALLAGFFALYFIIAQAYRAMPGYAHYINLFFGADHVDALKGWVANHKGTHPLLLLVVVPLGWFLSQFFPTYTLAMVVLAAGAGGLAVALVFTVVRFLTGRTATALAIALFFGFSMSQMVFGCIPDTYDLVIISLIPTYLLTLWCLRGKSLFFPFWVGAGLIAFSITITSALQTALCLAVILFAREKKGRAVSRFLLFLVLVTAGGFLLSLLQKGLIPEAKLFFMPAVYEHEMQYTSKLILENPAFVIRETLKSFFLFNFIGRDPIASFYEPGIRLKLVYYKASVDFGWFATAAAALWLGLFLRGVFYSFRDEKTRLFTLAAALAIAANMGLHAIYGTRELFLYTAHFTFVVLLLGLSARSVKGVYVSASWWLLALLTAVNNLIVVARMLHKFAG